jgi:hypothetical protein
MSEIQTSFKRYEKKFLLTPQQYDAIQPEFQQYMAEDAYGLHTICNIYYDTPTYALIRASVEKPAYKEKFRLRSYGIPTDDSTIFAEIKKKCNGIVYKRRVAAPRAPMEAFLAGADLEGENVQIQREIRWMLGLYQPDPKVFLAYDRRAFAGREDPELRVTFDWNIRWRTTDLSLYAGDAGQPVLDRDLIVMEVKLTDAAPLWLARLLSEHQIYPTTFSKYGRCYLQHIAPQEFQKGRLLYAQ